MLVIQRLMVMVHHSLWLIIGLLVVGGCLYFFGPKIHNTIGRNIAVGIGDLIVVFVIVTGMTIGPLDDWQHRHGSCLLEVIEKGKKK